MDLDHGQGKPATTDLQEIVELALEGIMAPLPEEVAIAIRLGAIPHWFDAELLARLAGDDVDTQQIVEYMRRLSFVRQDSHGHLRYHAEVRDYLIAWWQRERFHQFKEANRKVLAYFEASVETATVVERLTYEREILYHLLIEDEIAGRHYLSTHLEAFFGRYQLGAAESFLAQTAELTGILTAESRMWQQYFAARLDLANGRTASAEAILGALLTNTTDRVLQAIAQVGLSEIRVSQHQWSEAIRAYQMSLHILQNERAQPYVIRTMLALGDAYRDLARNNGGFTEDRGESLSTTAHFLYVFQHLPFLFYEWLVHRVSFLPNWYFGTNYQDWIISYLLVQAARWYRRAEKLLCLSESSEKRSLVDVQLALADIEHQLGRWSRAKQRYALLWLTDEVTGSLYRTACVRLGEGRALLDEGDLHKAEISLSQALTIFREFHDERSIGATATLLGCVYCHLGRTDQASIVFREGAGAFDAVNDRLSLTQVAWELEDLLQYSVLPEEQEQQTAKLLMQITERNYLARFPNTLLRWFRSLAFMVSLPLTCVFSFVIALSLIVGLMFIEGSVTLLTISPLDLINMFVAVILPLLALWFYRFIYSLIGLSIVHILGRWITPIEREQPAYYVTSPEGFTCHYAHSGVSQTITWAEFVSMASIDYRQWQRTIGLISSTSLMTASKPIVVDAITGGYRHLQRDVLCHIKQEQRDTEEQNLDFAIFNKHWLLATIGVSFVFALYLVYGMQFDVTWSSELPSTAISLPLSALMTPFASTLSLFFPMVVLWRLVYHQALLRKSLGYDIKIIPRWTMWLTAILCTLISIIWVIGLVALILSPSTIIL